MTRFIFMTDTHLGSGPDAFCQQPPYPERIKELLAEIRTRIPQMGVDFILHGGDLVHRCTREIVREAVETFRFPVPFYLSLGNHDLNHDEALRIWLEEAPGFFAEPSPQYSFRSGACVVHVIPNHWEPGRPYYWSRSQQPFFTDDQLERLEADIIKYPGLVHILSIHNPIFGVFPEQTGLPSVIHDVPSAFRDTVLALMRAYPDIKCVLSGHNHLNTLVRTKEGIFASASSFVETPFEYKLVEITENYIFLKTHNVSPLPFEARYDGRRAYAQGRERDRELFWRFDE